MEGDPASLLPYTVPVSRSALIRVTYLLLALAAARATWTALAYFQNGRHPRHRVEAAWMILVALGLVTAALAAPRFNRHQEASPEATSRGSLYGALAAAIALSVTLYWPAFSIGLLSDDFVLLGRSWSETVSPRVWEFYRPLPLLLWKVLFPIGGPAALHALNILLHGLNAWLVARLARRLEHTALVSSIAGFVFLAFPAAVEPVAWNSGIFDVAMVTLGLLYLHACAATVSNSVAQPRSSVQSELRPRPRTVLKPSLLLTAALLTKETAVALPLIAAILSFRVRIPARTLLASLVVTVAYVMLRIWAGMPTPLRAPPMLRYAVKEVIVRPFASLGIPWTGHELAAHPVLLGAVTASVLTTLVYLYCLRPSAGARAVIGPAIVLSGVLPLWQILFISDDLEGSRYLYLPLVGWSLLMADLVAHRGTRMRLYSCAVVALLATSGVWGVRQHLAPWQEAAHIRDVVLHSAWEKLSESACSEVRFENVPETVAGAFIFRNGLPQALQQTRPTEPGLTAPCTLVWTDGRFVKAK
jgi:hypothetical protein